MTHPDDRVSPPAVGAEQAPAVRACLFSVSGARLAVDVRSAREVALFDEMTPVPRAPRYLVGVANLRGTVVPIVDVAPLLGRSALRAPRSVRTLVLRDGPLLAAVAVEAVLGLEPFEAVLPPDTPDAPGDRVPHRFVTGWVSWVGETLPLLDVGRLLAELRTGSAGNARNAA
ncbi:MAG TPA: chemotaxis protein CheW [Methylomirabilota bacterium]|nr:chemotaxis protein CheW [Methylomirabilota bacterium]